MRFLQYAIFAVSFILASGSACAKSPPQMSLEEGRQLYAAGGFPVRTDKIGPLNKCGEPAKPKITFVDINTDGIKDALFLDAGTCYAPEGKWFSIAVKDKSGSWHNVTGENGTPRLVGTRTGGYYDIEWKSAGGIATLYYDGNRYSNAALTPAVAAVTPQTEDAEATLFLAAGFTKRGKSWRSDCDDPGTASYSPGVIETRSDLNGDGLPDAIITEGGTYCYGMTGTGFWLLSKQANNVWKIMASSQGIPNLLKTKGVDGWPDILVGGPGFCFPVLRWNGQEYALNRTEYEGKRCNRQP